MVNKKRLLSLTEKLIQIDSQNPPGDESRIALFVKAYLQRLGLIVAIHEYKKKRSNVIAVLKGRDRRRSLLLTPHLDTVPCGKHWHYNPLKATLKNGNIYGLGATDCKGNLACGIEAINSIVEKKAALGYNLIFAATADEESGSGLGLIPLLEKRVLKPDAAVVLDSDDFEIIVEQKGLLHLKVKVRGKRAHGAYPWRGINAIEKAIAIIQDLRAAPFVYTKNKYLRPPTMNIGTIKGGDKVNVVADWCEFELDFRFLPGMSAQKIIGELKEIVKKHSRRYTIEIEGIQKPYQIDTAHSLVRYLKLAARHCHVRAPIRGSEGATVITFFQDLGIPAVATGFGRGGCAHTVDEYAQVETLYKGALLLEHFLTQYRFAA